MKKTVNIILLAILCCILSITVYANPTKTIRVGYIENFGTLDTPITKGYEGYGYEFLNKIMEYSNGEYELEFIECSAQEINQMLIDGKIDLVGPGKYNKDYEEYFIYTDNDFGVEGMFLATLKENEVYFNDFNALDDKVIGTPSFNPNKEKLEEYVKERDLNTKIINGDHENYIDEMKAGLYDYCILTSLMSEEDLRIVFPLWQEEIYYYTNKQNAEFMQEFNRAREEFEKNEINFENEIFIKYFEKNFGDSANISMEENLLIRDKAVYNVGIKSDYYPMTYIEDGQPKGVFIDIMNFIAQELKITLKYIDMDLEPDKHIDMAIQLQNDSEKNISTPYLEVPYIIFGDYQVVENPKVGIDKIQYSATGTKLQKFLSEMDYAIYDGLDELVDDLLKGKISGVILTSLSIDRLSQKVDMQDYSMNPLGSTFGICIEYPMDFPVEKIAIINKIIQTIDSKIDTEYILIEHLSKNSSERNMQTTIAQDFIYVFCIIISVCIVFFEVRKRKSIKQLVEQDDITGFAKDLKFVQEVKKILKQKADKKYLLVSVDIDNFKYINEVYGYNVGTEVIKEFARYLDNKEMPPILVSRRFSDNFIILEEEQGFDKKSEHMIGHQDILNNKLKEIIGEDYNLTFSTGVYKIKDRNLTLDYMIDCANYARNAIKNNVTNAINWYSEEMNNERENKNRVVANMNKALFNNEFVVYYQPKVDMKTKEINGAEALVRWIKDGKIIPPDDFIPVFEKNGFIEKLDYYVVREVCKFIKTHTSEGLPIISVNLSGITVMKDDLVENILKIIEDNGISANQLDLEITESAFVGNFEDAVSKLDELRELWFKISMDDFGAGISSLNRLKQIPLDILKIDREFIVGCLENQKGAKIIKNIIQMADDLKLETVAEGIETKEQYDFLNELGCNVGQGYYFAKALPAEQFILRIRRK